MYLKQTETKRFSVPWFVSGSASVSVQHSELFSLLTFRRTESEAAER